MFQEIIVFLIVGGAIFYLARQVTGTFNLKNNAQKGCGKCGGCDSGSTSPKAPPQQLLQIQVKKKP